MQALVSSRPPPNYPGGQLLVTPLKLSAITFTARHFLPRKLGFSFFRFLCWMSCSGTVDILSYCSDTVVWVEWREKVKLLSVLVTHLPTVYKREAKRRNPKHCWQKAEFVWSWPQTPQPRWPPAYVNLDHQNLSFGFNSSKIYSWVFEIEFLQSLSMHLVPEQPIYFESAW